MEEQQIPMNLKVEKRLHQAFKRYAKKRRDTMTRLLINFMREQASSDPECAEILNSDAVA